MICPLCKKENTVDMRFCMFCGKEIPRCPSCGTVISKRIAVCPNDGTALPEHILALLPAEQELNADTGCIGNRTTGRSAGTSCRRNEKNRGDPQRAALSGDSLLLPLRKGV